MKIAIYGSKVKKGNEHRLRDVFDSIERHNGQMYFHVGTLDYLRSQGIQPPTYEGIYEGDLPQGVDYMIALGGDGTLLRAGQLAYRNSVPVMGVNMGNLGFIATVSKDRIHEAMEVLFQGRMVIEEKILLQVDSPALPESLFAINEVVVSRKDSSSMIAIRAHVNDGLLGTYRADGLIVSTPTGSTGYSLSCGGPIVSSDSSTLILAPVAPHNLNVRPIVFRDDVKISLKVYGREDQYLLSLDSCFFPMNWEDEITVCKAKHVLRVAKLPGTDFFLTLKEKLGWGNDGRE